MTAPHLTTKERAVLAGIAAGCTYGALAAQLYANERTVKRWGTGLFRKLAVKDRAHAVAKAYRLGLLVVPGCTCRGGAA